ncbi:MAG: esterase family protein [Rhizobacter sp.]|nr:esterase family protein [Chlorobiales bacterium]
MNTDNMISNPPLISPRGVHTLTGDIRHHRSFGSDILKRERDLIVYLPPDYEQTKQNGNRYPVLYLQDGQNLFDGATSFAPGKEWEVDETAEALITAGEIAPLIIVGIYNAGEARNDEYTHTQVSLRGGKNARRQTGGLAKDYGRMLVEELKPFIDQTYRTLPDAVNTGVGGSSLGAVVSLYLGLMYPHVFNKLALLSTSVWWDNRVLIKNVDMLPEKLPLKIWLDVGTEEGGSMMLRDTRLLCDAFVQKGWRMDGDLAYLEVHGGVHDEAAWAKRVGPFLRFLFPPASSDTSNP